MERMFQLLACLIFASLVLSSSVHAHPKVLVMATSDGPPHMIEATDSGLDIDIPRAVLKQLGYELRVMYMPLARAQKEVINKRVDMMTPMFVGQVEGLYLSDPAIIYRPTAFSLTDQQLSIQQLSDLAQQRIMTFQGATGYFGDVFVDASKRSPEYLEMHDMSMLPKLLLAGRTDVVVLDFYIFKHYRKKLGDYQREVDVTAHAIFPKVPAVVAFHDRELRDRFNEGLKQIKAQQIYQQILQKYSQ